MERRTGELLSTLEGHLGSVRSVAFSPDGARLASGSDDHTIKLWDVEVAELLNTLKGHSHWVQSVDFNSEGTVLVSGSRDEHASTLGRSRQWCDACILCEGHWDGVTSVAFGTNGMRLASGFTGQYGQILGCTRYAAAV